MVSLLGSPRVQDIHVILTMPDASTMMAYVKKIISTSKRVPYYGDVVAPLSNAHGFKWLEREAIVRLLAIDGWNRYQFPPNSVLLWLLAYGGKQNFVLVWMSL